VTIADLMENPDAIAGENCPMDMEEPSEIV
jgi:hypothetical protein